MKQSTIKMDLLGNSLLMIEVRLWNLEDKEYNKIDLTLDTGASITTISKDIY